LTGIWQDNKEKPTGLSYKGSNGWA